MPPAAQWRVTINAEVGSEDGYLNASAYDDWGCGSLYARFYNESLYAYGSFSNADDDRLYVSVSGRDDYASARAYWYDAWGHGSAYGNIMNDRLKLDHSLAKRLTYHDPCYLGRYSGMYEPPREVLKSIPSLDFREMRRSRIDSLCCGAGGGWMWMDEKIGTRMNIARLEDALTTKPDWIATACPFCVTMFDDAIKDKNKEDDVKIWDIAELVEQAIFGEKKRSSL